MEGVVLVEVALPVVVLEAVAVGAGNNIFYGVFMI